VELLQVPQAAVDELAGPGGRAGGEVARLDQGHGQAPGGGVDGRTGSGDSAADDDDVEAVPAQAGQGGLTPRRREPRRGEGGDRRVAHGSTVRHRITPPTPSLNRMNAPERTESTGTVIVAGLANLAIAAAKAIAGLLSGSAAVLAEAVHSLADTLTEILLF